MPRGRPRNNAPLVVKLAILGNGVTEHCVAKDSTVGDLFTQAGEEMGETVKMNGREVDEDTKITSDGATITSTNAVKGG